MRIQDLAYLHTWTVSGSLAYMFARIGGPQISKFPLNPVLAGLAYDHWRVPLTPHPGWTAILGNQPNQLVSIGQKTSALIPVGPGFNWIWKMTPSDFVLDYCLSRSTGLPRCCPSPPPTGRHHCGTSLWSFDSGPVNGSLHGDSVSAPHLE